MLNLINDALSRVINDYNNVTAVAAADCNHPGEMAWHCFCL